MSNLKIDGNVLHVIQRTNNPSPRLFSHLTEETPYLDNFTYLDPTFKTRASKTITEFISEYLVQLSQADAKYKIEKVVFEIVNQDQKLPDELRDEKLAQLFNNLVKTAGKYKSTSGDSNNFFFRRPMAERLFGSQVLDMGFLFEAAEQLKELDRSPPRME